MPAIQAPDDLSEWTLPPPASGEVEPIRAFSTAADAIAFLDRHGGGGSPAVATPFSRIMSYTRRFSSPLAK